MQLNSIKEILTQTHTHTDRQTGNVMCVLSYTPTGDRNNYNRKLAEWAEAQAGQHKWRNRNLFALFLNDLIKSAICSPQI